MVKWNLLCDLDAKETSVLHWFKVVTTFLLIRRLSHDGGRVREEAKMVRR